MKFTEEELVENYTDILLDIRFPNMKGRELDPGLLSEIQKRFSDASCVHLSPHSSGHWIMVKVECEWEPTSTTFSAYLEDIIKILEDEGKKRVLKEFL